MRNGGDQLAMLATPHTPQKEASAQPWLDFDGLNFDPWRVTTVMHRVHEHPLFAVKNLVALGARLEDKCQVRTHADAATAGTSFNDAPRLHPNRKSAVDTLSDIQNAGAWMSLLNIQTDQQYRSLVDTVLDDVKPRVDRSDPGMWYRAGWIFVTSPRAITPFHMDKEHNFILQIMGRKRLYVWQPDDTVAVSEAARDLFHHTHDRALIKWRDELKERALVFDLEPGIGAYMPSTAPHLVENGDGASITASFTYYTNSTRRNSLLHAANNRLRSIGLNPPPVGSRPLRDALVFRAVSAALRAKSVVRQPARLGQQGAPAGRYATHRFS